MMARCKHEAWEADTEGRPVKCCDCGESLVGKPYVGMPVWVWDQDKSKYDEAGKYIGRGDWIEKKIVGETRVSWLIGHAPWWDRPPVVTRKVPKREPIDFCRRLVAFSKQDIENHRLVDSRYSIGLRVQRCLDVSILRTIVELLDKGGIQA
jgi:hypothetical protein